MHCKLDSVAVSTAFNDIVISDNKCLLSHLSYVQNGAPTNVCTGVFLLLLLYRINCQQANFTVRVHNDR